MLIWGTGGETKDLGVVETKHCQTCEKERPFKLFLQYKFSHIWYAFRWVSQKQYLLLCDVCHRGSALDAEHVESSFDKHPIPFGTRYGWTFLLGLIVAGVAFAVVDGHNREERDAAFIDRPVIDDLYVTNLAKLMKDPQSPYMYGVMRVKTVSGNRVEFHVSNVTYSKVSSATRDVESAKALAPNYYGPNVLSILSADLKAMRQEGAISSVHRQ